MSAKNLLTPLLNGIETTCFPNFGEAGWPRRRFGSVLPAFSRRARCPSCTRHRVSGTRPNGEQTGGIDILVLHCTRSALCKLAARATRDARRSFEAKLHESRHSERGIKFDTRDRLVCVVVRRPRRRILGTPMPTMFSAGIHELHDSSQIRHTLGRSRLKVVLPSVTWL